MIKKSTWYKLSLFNLALVALLGVLLRYNMVYYIPFLDQRNLLHSHSHFAFAGWVGFLLNVLVIDKFLGGYEKKASHWNTYTFTSAIVNYAMMVSFLLQGYKAASIVFSTASILINYYFAYRVSKDLSQSAAPKYPKLFIKAALIFLVVSSLGPYALGYLSVTGNTHAYYNHNALYWFLHFQYNGFFSFSVLGLLFFNLCRQGLNHKYLKSFFWMLALIAGPAYLLTLLTRTVIPAVIVSNVISAVVLVIAVILFTRIIYNNWPLIMKQYSTAGIVLMSVSLSAYVLKVLLQAMSAHTGLSHLVFGYRSIVVGYLHLVFLVFISLFLIAELLQSKVLTDESPARKSFIYMFILAVLLNEALLGLQGLSAVSSISIPDMQPALFYNAVLLFVSAAALFASTLTQSYKSYKIHKYANPYNN